MTKTERRILLNHLVIMDALQSLCGHIDGDIVDTRWDDAELETAKIETERVLDEDA